VDQGLSSYLLPRVCLNRAIGDVDGVYQHTQLPGTLSNSGFNGRLPLQPCFRPGGLQRQGRLRRLVVYVDISKHRAELFMTARR
jgi:hypothetical protein